MSDGSQDPEKVEGPEFEKTPVAIRVALMVILAAVLLGPALWIRSLRRAFREAGNSVTTKAGKLASHFDAGLSAHRQGHYQEAEEHFLLDLEDIREQGGNSAALAPTLNNLAESYEGEHKYAQAESFYKQSLATYEKTLGPGLSRSPLKVDGDPG